MHIVGLLGMTRRVYTYQSDHGWGAYNLSETIGSYILAAGLLLIALNLAVSFVRGPRVGPNPWNAPTLEWATTSPPPEFNFPVIPRVRSPYPVWEPADESGLVLDQGHEMTASTVRDAVPDEILHVPSESATPILVALPVTVTFAMLLTSHFVIALSFALLGALVLGAWHSKEPQET
jgi:cytochrome c oxidase subunit 1/cytochrome c oxidase subunit I+III